MLLKAKNVSKIFPGVIALKDFNFELNSGEIHCLVGENGAGKSTFVKILSGAYKDYYGDIYINNRKVIINSPEKALSTGIAAIQQERDLIREITCYENIFLGNEITNKVKVINSNKELEQAKKLINKFNIDIDLRKPLYELSIAEQEIVAICKALSRKCKILIIDEAAAPLERKEKLSLFEIIKELKKHDISIIYISHDIEEVFKIGDKVTILRDGKKVSTLSVKETSVREVVKKMIGKEYKKLRKDLRDLSGKKVVLEVNNLSLKDKLFGINFNVKIGEILGICGLQDSNKYFLPLSIYGLIKRDSGEIILNGKKVNLNSPSKSLKKGVGLVPDDRREKGLLGCLSLRDNIIISSINKNKKFIVRNSFKSSISKRYKEKLKIVATDILQKVNTLSGGNQQKVIFSRWLAADVNILMLIEPTEGIDINARSEIYGMLNEYVKNGNTIILVSSDIDEIVNLSDRVLVMKKGQAIKQFEGANISKKKIMESLLLN